MSPGGVVVLPAPSPGAEVPVHQSNVCSPCEVGQGAWGLAGPTVSSWLPLLVCAGEMRLDPGKSGGPPSVWSALLGATT